MDTEFDFVENMVLQEHCLTTATATGLATAQEDEYDSFNRDTDDRSPTSACTRALV